MIDYYDLLSISPDADESAVRRAYRRTALKYHPDKNDSPDAAQVFSMLTEALETLLAGDRRTAYDEERRTRKDREARLSAKGARVASMRADLGAREAAHAQHQSPELLAKLQRLRMDGFNRRRQLDAEMAQGRIRRMGTESTRTVKITLDGANVRIEKFPGIERIIGPGGDLQVLFQSPELARVCVDELSSRGISARLVASSLPSQYSQQYQQNTLQRLRNLDRLRNPEKLAT